MKSALIVIVISLLACLSIPAFAEEGTGPVDVNQFRIGAGRGVAYGGLGINTEYRINKYASVAAGLGYKSHINPGWAVGAMFYPLKNDEIFNPRLTGYYGRVSTIGWNSSVNGHRYEAVYGGALGPGFDWRINKRFTLGVDVLYLIRDMPANVQYRHNAINISAGIGIIF